MNEDITSDPKPVIKTEPKTPPVATTLPKEELVEKAAKEKEEKRNKEKEVVRKQVEEAATLHAKLGEKFQKEDAEEAEKKAKAEAKEAEKK